ncbi:YopX family protein, partial [Lentilactobacillus parakefiri]
MSREIKFRAWDVRSGKCYYNVENTWMNNTCFGDLLASPNFEIDEFTGLKDSNGDDIYENDLVMLDPDDPPYQVIFDEGKFELGLKSIFETDFKRHSEPRL